MSDISLDDVLNGVENEEITPQVEESQEAEEQQGEQGEAMTKAYDGQIEEPQTGETTSPQDEDKEDWQYKAYKDEKSKRQERDAKIAELEEKLSQLSQKESQIPDVLDDQEGFVNSLRNEVQQQVSAIRTDLSREFMMSIHDDYEEKEKIFIELANQTPELAAQLRNSSNPAKFAYDQAKKHEEFKEMQDVDSYKAKIRAEVEAQIKAEYEEKAKSNAEKTSNITPSLANARAAKESETVEIPSLDDLL